MSTPRALTGLAIASLVLVAACSSGGGSTWTFAPPQSPAPTEVPSGGPSAVPSQPPASQPPASAQPSGAPSAVPGSPAPSEVPGDARVIELELTGALQITADGAQVTDIPVTPGETVRFVVTNTGNILHNFYIGTEAELSVFGGTTEAGIPDFSEGTQELEWVVPADVTGLMFGCTVPGHFTLMKGTFSAR